MTELMQLAAFVFAHSGVLEAFHVPSDSLASFLAECCSHYRANPYHNFHHGVHVLHGVYLHARAGQGLYAAPLTPLELFALLTAAIGHDLEHPGVTNAFLIKTGAPPRHAVQRSIRPGESSLRDDVPAPCASAL